MKKRSVRLLFVIVLVVVFTEMLLAINLTEPFPAIMYPSFSDIPTLNSTIQKPSIIVFFRNEDSLEIDKKDFFYNMSNVYNNVILNENFNNINSFQITQRPVRTMGATIGTRKITMDLDEVWDDTQILEGKKWIAASLKENLKRDDFTRLEVQWYDYMVSQDEEAPLKRGKLVETFVVSFVN